MSPKCIQNVSKMVPQDSIGKDSIGKISKEKNKYGKFENVLLSDIELSKLQETYSDRSEKIETLSE